MLKHVSKYNCVKRAQPGTLLWSKKSFDYFDASLTGQNYSLVIWLDTSQLAASQFLHDYTHHTTATTHIQHPAAFRDLRGNLIRGISRVIRRIVITYGIRQIVKKPAT